MPIDVTCPGCHKRFKVSDKFAGQKGPCPQCKTVMEIPKLEDQVVIHAPDETSGPKDAKGRSVLKTAKKKDAKFNPIMAGAVGGVVLLMLLAAFLLRGQEEKSIVALAGGAVLLGPLIAWAGYPILRDNELEPYSGGEAWLRALGCGLAMAAGWGVYCYIGYYFGGGDWPIRQLEMVHMLFAVGFALAIGGLAAFVAFDLEPLNAALLAGFYFVVTVALRLVMDLPALPGLVT
ncbi:hypothetical protein KOR34_11860 [Posidoniimonas corsicana]|uniref:Zinc finger/thioredoxin putative domain-containing protein n=1 Tax=Posidoniimonas corsicana TaxID=1938618 RepID=A0A5C5VF19_9BACT|nr:hypothetical protein [Posidoniimonas corsicana]TWT36282.1 hypothetical protein KOR34_11860 [Posidoniimonas corsicana]